MTSPSPSAVVIILVLVIKISSAYAFGSTSATIAAVYGGASPSICTLTASQSPQKIQCFKPGQGIRHPTPSIAVSAVSGGAGVLCGVVYGGGALLCWDNSFTPRRLYYNESTPLASVDIGGGKICGLTNAGDVVCWRGGGKGLNGHGPVKEISSGLEFSCGILEVDQSVFCWGDSDIASYIQAKFSNVSMMNIVVGGRHACGIGFNGSVICAGSNDHGQLNVPSNSSYEYMGLALGGNHSCGIRRVDRNVVCWGGKGGFGGGLIDGVSFESAVAGADFSCGLVSSNFSVVCWGFGWPKGLYPVGVSLPLAKSLPRSCVKSFCKCGTYPESQELCSSNGHICRTCDVVANGNSRNRPPLAAPPPSPSMVKALPPSRRLTRNLLIFAIVGSVGTFAGILTIIYCLWIGVCFGKRKIHDSGRPTVSVVVNDNPQQSSGSLAIFTRSFRRQGSRLMRRQRSGTSSKQTERAEEFQFSDLVAATNNFSLENKIGAGSFGVVYRGKLPQGLEVAIKRGEMSVKTKKLKEKENAFESELAFLSRLHHKHLVGLVGYCEENGERLLVYDYMKNGALHDHLHDKNNVGKSSSVLNSWKMRIKIALDAARGIEYLHNYAVPPIIHRDIKSSNILLDANWTARVSDFGLSLMGPEFDDLEFKPIKAAGTIGYIDPEYYKSNVLTAKSDVYGFGVVLLELLTGKKAIFRNDEGGSSPLNLVDYAVPVIEGGEMAGIFDTRVGPPDSRETEAVEILAYTAMHCANYQGKERPTMTDVVSLLERALSIYDHSHASISSDPLSILSE